MVTSIDRRVTPFTDAESRFRAGRLGMWFFLASLAMLFAASLAGFVVLRIQLRDVWPEDMPPLPRVMVLSTIALFVSSGTVQWAAWSAQQDRAGGLRAALALTTCLGFAFLAIQALAWLEWLPLMAQRLEASGAQDHRYALASFFVLTGLHALHVIGGLIFLLTAALGSFRREPAVNRGLVNHVAIYWHFLGCVWLVLYATLLIGA